MGEFKLPFRVGGFSGAFGVGKTLACLDLLVMAKAGGVPKEEMLVLDTHGSVEPYLMLDQYKDVFELRTCLNIDEILKTLDAIKAEKRKRSIMVIDTVELIQDKLVEDVWNDPSLSDNYKEKAKSFMWGRVKKTLLNRVLDMMVNLSSVMLFTIHTRKEFVAGQPTGNQETKFLEPIMQLCQFVAILTRRKNIKLPDASFAPPKGKTQFPGLPPAIQEFTWPKFFSYVGKTPADWGNLKKEEMAQSGLELLEKIAALKAAEEEGGEP